MKPSPSDDIFPWISAENLLRYHKLRPTASGAYPRRKLVCVVVEVVDLVFLGENMPIWMIGGWIAPGGLT